MNSWLQYSWFDIGLIVVLGRIVMLKFSGIPAQVKFDWEINGVTKTEETIGFVVEIFIALKSGMLPTPVAAIPMVGIEFVQLKSAVV